MLENEIVDVVVSDKENDSSEIVDKEIKVDEIEESREVLDRELSWLDFNSRVLDQVYKDIPLKERFNFLSITSSNLDEFTMVRLPTTYLYDREDPRSKDIYKKVLLNRMMQDKAYNDLKEECMSNNIEFIRDLKSLEKKELKIIDKIFDNHIYPFVSPIAYDSSRQFPLIKSKELVMIVVLEDERSQENVINIISLKGFDRAYDISDNPNIQKIVFIEDIVERNLNEIFINKKISSCGLIKVLRNSNTEITHEENIYIVDRMRKVLFDRERNDVEYIEVSKTFDKEINKTIRGIFGIKKSQFNVVEFVDISSLNSIPFREGLSYKEFKPQFPNTIAGSHDMFDAIDEDDIILHHPYHSFEPIIDLLEHAASDDDVVNIKQTLYRVSSDDSPIIKALCKAARNGKDVVVMVELKARFDESRNLEIIETLKNSGVKVVHGPEALKTHCKAILITKRTRKGVRYYSHIGTGNYSERNARVYTDISYFTSNQKIGMDLTKLFNALSGFSDPVNMKVLKHSPYNLRSTLMELIDEQILKTEEGKNGQCIFKINSLSDQIIIDKINEAASKGVKFTILVRGICTLRSGKNIMIRSLVGRFLEHSRIYYFLNDDDNKIFISSADLLTRNLDGRIELLTPIKDMVKSEVVEILNQSLSDTHNSYEMSNDGVWTKVVSDKDINIHDYFMKKVKAESKLRSTYVMSTNKK